MQESTRKLLDYFSDYITENKKELMERVLEKRTRAISVVLEDIYQAQNASAVVRTCDCFGIQDLHVIENKHNYNLNPRVVHGASKWISINRYNEGKNNTADCLRSLKAKGYRILGTTPDKSALCIHEYPMHSKTALLFGTEATGITDEGKALCDELVTFPMYGFTESLNLSVSVSLCLGALRRTMEDNDMNWGLTDAEKDEIRLEWYRHSVNRNDIHEREFMKKLK